MYAKIFYSILTLTRFAMITDKNILMKFNMYEKKLVIFFNMVFFKVSCASVMHLELDYRFAMKANKNILMNLNM